MLERIKSENANYITELIEYTEEKEREIFDLCEDFAMQIHNVIEQKFPDCPAITIFKSPRRTKDLIEALDGLPQSGQKLLFSTDGQDEQMTLAL